MAEHDVAMVERRPVLRQFLEAENDRILRRLRPQVLGHDLATRRDVSVDRNGPHRAFLDADMDASLDQRGGTFGRQAHPLLIRPLFRPDP
jgi:hypothetical protein